VSSAAALFCAWWWLRALVRPGVALGGALVLGFGPVFWGNGAMAANYTAIVAVGAFLLGVAFRGHAQPRAWHPYAAAVTLAAGTGYRTDLGMLWLPLFAVILWQHRWQRAIGSAAVFTLVNLAWLSAMLYDVGGWARYQAASSEFAYSAGVRNSAWQLGFVDGPARYSVKLGMALLWTLGPALLFVPRGIARLREVEHGGALRFMMAVSILPALAFHLLIHFGAPGYSFHYVPALIALAALGIGRSVANSSLEDPGANEPTRLPEDRAELRLLGIAVTLAAAFWFYPTDYGAPGLRGQFDLSFCRYTRIGLRTPPRDAGPTVWRTANSRQAGGRSLREPARAATTR
jgi:hypothetical protein